MLQAENPSIEIPFRQFFVHWEKIDPRAVQPYISQEALTQFCLRLQSELRANRKIDIIASIMIILDAFAFVITSFFSNYQFQKSISTIINIAAVGILLWIINQIIMTKKLRSFLLRENVQSWNSAGLNWAYSGFFRPKSLILQPGYHYQAQAPLSNYNPIANVSVHTPTYANPSSQTYHPDQPAHELCMIDYFLHYNYFFCIVSLAYSLTPKQKQAQISNQ